MVPPRIFLIIILMVFFCRIEIRVRPDFCCNRFFELPGTVKVFLRGFCKPFLLVVMVEDCGVVLGPLVSELAFCIGRIDLPPENIEELIVRDRTPGRTSPAPIPGALLCLTRPVHRSGSLWCRLAYPDTTSVTPLRFRNGGCMHQKQPPENVAFFIHYPCIDILPERVYEIVYFLSKTGPFTRDIRMSLRLAPPGFNQLHRFAVADHFAAAGFPYDNHISADVTSVYFTGFLNVYHITIP